MSKGTINTWKVTITDPYFNHISYLMKNFLEVPPDNGGHVGQRTEVAVVAHPLWTGRWVALELYNAGV